MRALIAMTVGATISFLSACSTNGDEPASERGAGAQGGKVQRIIGSGLVTNPAGLFLATLDQNGDQIVTDTELDAALKDHWQTADTNADGTLSSMEFEEWALLAMGSRETLPNRLSFDTDLSGQISVVEFEIGWEQEYAAFDANQDRTLSRNELLARLPRRPARMPSSMRGQMRPPPGQTPPGGRPR